MKSPWWSVVWVVLALPACARGDRALEGAAADSAAAAAPAPDPQTPVPAPDTAPFPDTARPPATGPDTARVSDLARGWVVGFEGVGPVRIGMTKAQARAALGPDLDWPEKPDENCAYAAVRPLGRAIGLMIVNGRIARVEVRTSLIATAAGARVGDTEPRIRRLYGSALRVEPHKYQAGHYLILTAPGDTTRRLIFETNGDTITTFRAGVRPQVDWVEGCA